MTTQPNRKPLVLVLMFMLLIINRAQGRCWSGCNLALASYYLWEGTNLTYISKIFGKPISEILKYNPSVKIPDVIQSGTRINVPFSCECLNGEFLGHTFSYLTQHGNTYTIIAKVDFSNLTTEEWVRRVNRYHPNEIPDNVNINVTINCSCGDRHVSKDYGLFLTYPLRPGDDLPRLAAESGVQAELLQRYNPASDFTAGSGIVFVPAKGK
ncbi:LysM domain [Sesbania bispinosa]|nr:LysM domain [Sesbania bispinosa]